MANVDRAETTKFDRLAARWWDIDGESRPLHDLNPVRFGYIAERAPLQGGRVLDVGCGGGILSEALARAGAEVVAIDLAPAVLDVARLHLHESGLKVDYREVSVEDLAARMAATFDVVTCMEMLEHVPDPNQTIAACAKLLKPGGHAYFSTINRTLKAGFMVIFGGEYILRLLPRGTHTYSKLIRPDELRKWAAQNGLEFQSLASLIYNPFNKTFKVKYVEDNNYMAHFVKKQ
jgi:2-polyprenyl-6-hydroxyphenyl methylase/3-demethylubiquinone-9 3-methyltransferase